MKLKNIVPFLLLCIIYAPLAVFANGVHDIDPMTLKAPHDVFEKTIDFDTCIWTIDFSIDPYNSYHFNSDYWDEFITYDPGTGDWGWPYLKPKKVGNTTLVKGKEVHWVNIVEHLN
ncbi:MAG: hypothetical protein PHY59_00635 [Methanobacterium sp.]|nr:hypothetical protein [Methanobacterium sp.]